MSSRRIYLLGLALSTIAALAPRSAPALERGGHQVTVATTRRPTHEFFAQQWPHLCVEVKAPDIPGKPLSHAADRLERCAESFSAATTNYSDRKRSADTLAHAAHYLQDGLAPRGEASLAVHREMINQSHGMLNDARQRAAFHAAVDRIKSDLKSRNDLGALLAGVGEKQREIQRAIDKLMLTKGDVTTRDHAKDKYWRYRSATELSPVERGQFDEHVAALMAANAAYTERMYELFLEKVDPEGARNATFEFDPSGIKAALDDEDVRALFNPNPPRVDRPAAGERRAELGEFAAEGTGPSDEGADATGGRPGDVATDTTSDEKTDERPDDTGDGEAVALEPVVARGGPWSIELKDGAVTMTEISLFITKDGKARLSGFQFAAPPLILEADARFAAADRTNIEVDPNQPEIAVKVTFVGHLTIQAMTFTGELVKTRRQATCVVTRQADGTWVADGFGYPRAVVLKPAFP